MFPAHAGVTQLVSFWLQRRVPRTRGGKRLDVHPVFFLFLLNLKNRQYLQSFVKKNELYAFFLLDLVCICIYVMGVTREMIPDLL